jgi:hypothetical protein
VEFLAQGRGRSDYRNLHWPGQHGLGNGQPRACCAGKPPGQRRYCRKRPDRRVPARRRPGQRGVAESATSDGR